MQLRTKESEVEDLHAEIEKLAIANFEFAKHTNMEKDLLISQNSELKK